jgi:hypothetical protein
VKLIKCKAIVVLVGICVSFLAITYLAGQLSSQNKWVDSAMAECRAKGWRQNDLGLSRSQFANYGLLSTATITLKSKDRDQPKIVHF